MEMRAIIMHWPCLLSTIIILINYYNIQKSD